jgi:alginate O-acetyltransferase complex protein AlgJ
MTTQSEDITQAAAARTSRGFALATIALVLTLLWLPLLGTLMADRRAVSSTEKRFLASAPRLEAKLESGRTFPRAFDAWYDDHVGFRDTLIRSYALLKIELFGVSPTDTLVVGKSGWFFFGDPDALAQYRGVDPLSEAELARWAQVVRERRDWLAERGVAYLLVLVPDKHLVYPEFMPDQITRTGSEHPLDQLAAYLARETDVPVLDLRAPLLKEKPKTRVYHRTDSHWNDVGAYVGYTAILDRLRTLVPALADAVPTPAVQTRETTPGLGLASIVGLQRAYPEEVIGAQKSAPRSRPKPEHRATYAERERTLQPLAHGVDDARLPRAVVFRDSFGNALIPYLSENFRRILYVWNRDVDPRVVEIEKPDVVIQEVVGRFLGRRPKTLSEVRRIRQR